MAKKSLAATLLLVFCSIASPSQAVTITHGPRLGLITSTQATIYWDTDVSGNSGLEYGTTTSYGNTLTGQDASTYHRVAVTGLSPETTYYFSAETSDASGNVASANGSFTTATTNKNARFQFITMADNRGDHGGKYDIENGLPQEFLYIIQDASNRVGDASPGYIAFAVNAGDIFATASDASDIRPLYGVFKNATDPLATRIPYLVSPGNHEFTTGKGYDPAAIFNEQLAQPNQLAGYEGTVFSWDWGNSHFVIIDTSTKMMEVADDQLAWLETDLQKAQAAGARHIFVMGHSDAFAKEIPPWVEYGWYLGYWGGNPKYPAQRDKFWSKLANYNADAYICGHEHMFDDSITNDGVPQWLNGNSGAPLNAGAAQAYQYTLWTVDGETVTAELINSSGNVDYTRKFKSRQPSPNGAEKVETLTPTLTTSPWSDVQGSQWIVMDGSGNVIFITSCLDASGNSYSCFDPQNLTRFSVPTGTLSYDASYTWQVKDLDGSGNVSVSAMFAFSTPSKPENTSSHGVPHTVNEVNDESGTPVRAVKAGNIVALQADLTFRDSVPQIDTVAKIVADGSITDRSGKAIPVGPSGFSLVKTKGGTGNPIAIFAGGTNTIVSAMSISETGHTLDSSGNMVQTASFTTPAGVSLPYGIYDFVVTVTDVSPTKIVIVPPAPFVQGTKWYKLDDVAGILKEYPYFEVTAQGSGILTLTDNGAGDSHPTLGTIRDPGGPGFSGSASSVTGGGGSSGCFIATAAYGSYFHPFVKILRAFRDGILLSSSFGRAFVQWYYRISPPVADVIRTSDIMKAGARIVLLPVVGMSWLSLAIGFVPTLVVLLLLPAVILLGRRSP